MSPPVHRQVDPRDEAGRVRGQEGDGLGHLVHLSGPPQRVGLLALLQELGGKQDGRNEDPKHNPHSTLIHRDPHYLGGLFFIVVTSANTSPEMSVVSYSIVLPFRTVACPIRLVCALL